MYPTKMEANNRIYTINTDYKIGLACFKALYDEEITDLQRFYAIETLLLGENVDERDEMILKDKIIRYLKCGNEEEISNDEIDFDYLQDEKTVRTSIRQCYHIDLEKTPNLHWYEYNELISGLTTESLLNKIRDLRSYDISKINDEDERRKVIVAKERVALKERIIKTKEEKEIDELWDKILERS